VPQQFKGAHTFQADPDFLWTSCCAPSNRTQSLFLHFLHTSRPEPEYFLYFFCDLPTGPRFFCAPCNRTQSFLRTFHNRTQIFLRTFQPNPYLREVTADPGPQPPRQSPTPHPRLQRLCLFAPHCGALGLGADALGGSQAHGMIIKWGPNAVLCMPRRANCALLVSVTHSFCHVALITKTTWIQLFPFDMQSRTLGPYLAATHRSLVAVMYASWC
jgi:hypothetical protein